MQPAKSFFKREAVFTLLFQLGIPVLSLLFFLVFYLWRWASR